MIRDRERLRTLELLTVSDAQIHLWAKILDGQPQAMLALLPARPSGTPVGALPGGRSPDAQRADLTQATGLVDADSLRSALVVTDGQHSRLSCRYGFNR